MVEAESTNLNTSYESKLLNEPLVLSKWADEPFTTNSRIENELKEECNIVVDLERSYYRAKFSTVLKHIDKYVESDSSALSTMALAVRAKTKMATGDACAAYKDLVVLRDLCQKGMEDENDYFNRQVSLINAMRVEGLLIANLFEYPEFVKSPDWSLFSDGAKGFLGYLLALGLIRKAQYDKAFGVAYAFKMIVSDSYPAIRALLGIIQASTSMFVGKRDEANAEYENAWALASKSKTIMPFAENSFLAFGLHRSRIEGMEDKDRKRIDELSKTYQKSWFELRKMFGLTTSSGELTLSERYTASLAALGWRTKEIAALYGLSEQTVKHQLTSIYQKMGVSGRNGLKKAVRYGSAKQGHVS